MEASNQREFTRVPVHLHVEVKGGDRTIASAHTQSLSMKGLFVTCAEPLAEGTPCAITIVLVDGSIRIEAEGNVVHTRPDGMALQFTRIMGFESFQHLKSLVLYNAPDPDLVESEFKTSLGIHRTKP